MTEFTPFLKQMMSLAGLSAYEDPVRELISGAWRPLVDELSVSKLGSLHGLRRGSGPQPRRRLLLSAHMDAIGLIATVVDQGFIHFTQIGGVDPRILPGTPVMVHGRQALPGIVVMPPDRLLPASQREKPVAMEYLVVDTGLLPDEVGRLVRPGDLISFDSTPTELSGDTLSGHSLDNRSSVAAVTLCLEELQHVSHAWDVWAVASAQEEETLGGAATSAFDVRPDLAVAIDVTFAKGPGANGWETFPLGKGPTLGWGANLHPFLYRQFKELADKLEIPVSMEMTPTHSGTDAYAMQVAREGIPTMVLGIPLRYMHTPVEVIAVKDVLRVGRLLAEFIHGLEADFVNKIVWDDEQKPVKSEK
jgi:putative aminopeptidase FrvX